MPAAAAENGREADFKLFSLIIYSKQAENWNILSRFN